MIITINQYPSYQSIVNDNLIFEDSFIAT